jgi:hypothetical protein
MIYLFVLIVRIYTVLLFGQVELGIIGRGCWGLRLGLVKE